MKTSTHQSPLLNKWENDELRYSHVWEDFTCLEQLMAQEGLSNPKTVLTIASAGENALSFCCKGNSTIIALDLSSLQIQLGFLKKSAISTLCLEEYLIFIGLNSDKKETWQKIWKKVEAILPDERREFWRENQAHLELGVAHQGRLDRYFKKFRDQIFPQIWSSDDFQSIINAEDAQSQLMAFGKGDGDILKKAVSDFFSQQALSEEGRHESQFKYVEKKNIGSQFLKNFQQVISRDLVHQNPYLELFLTGRITPDSSHPLYAENTYKKIQNNLDQIQFRAQDLESFLSQTDQSFDFMNFSDVFEYLSPEQAENLYQLAAKKLNPGGVLAYWTLLVDRHPQTPLLQYCSSSENISKKDQTWFYSQFLGYKRV